jgi:anti-anti-sigma factor
MVVAIKKQGAVDVVGSDERITSDKITELRDELERLDHLGQPRVVLDMQRAALVDSAALEMLLDIQEQYQRKGGALKLANMNALCEEILRVTGVSTHFEMFDDVGSAVRSFVI